MKYYGVRWDLLQEAQTKFGRYVMRWKREAEARDLKQLLQNTGWRSFVPGWLKRFLG